MSKKKPDGSKAIPAKIAKPEPVDAAFAEVVGLVQQARDRALRAVNTELIDLYWSIGDQISRRVDRDGWGKGTILSLAQFIRRSVPGIVGFSHQNLWRMKQFFETYRDQPKLSPLVRVLPWTHNLLILGRAKRPEEREFYLRLCKQERWTKRELERQIDGALFERAVLDPPKVAAALHASHPDAVGVFRDAYFLEFLGLADDHSEADLHRALLGNLGRFLTEMGRDFCFAGSEYPVQVGGSDFKIDLVLFHRGLNCLVAVELKVEAFRPEHLGKLDFYLEALDRDVRKPHENPSIGLLLCASKDVEVVEYSLSRSLSPALVAEYQAHLPDKALLRAKLHEFYALASADAERAGPVLERAPANRKAKGRAR